MLKCIKMLSCMQKFVKCLPKFDKMLTDFNKISKFCKPFFAADPALRGGSAGRAPARPRTGGSRPLLSLLPVPQPIGMSTAGRTLELTRVQFTAGGLELLGSGVLFYFCIENRLSYASFGAWRVTTSSFRFFRMSSNHVRAKKKSYSQSRESSA